MNKLLLIWHAISAYSNQGIQSFRGDWDMFKKNPSWILFCFFIFENFAHARQQLAVIAAPVCDSGEIPRLTLVNSDSQYQQLPFSGGINQFVSCPRIHQFLYNEIVEIIKYKDKKVQVKALNSWFNVGGTDEPQCSYWINTANIIPLKKLKGRGIDISKLPPPISSKNPNNEDPNIVTLIAPFTDRNMNVTFSAGTRFKRAESSKYNQNSVNVYALDRKKMNINIVSIPQSLIIESIPPKQKEKIDVFVQLLKKWAHLDEGFIPYVWGGSSFTQLGYSIFTEIEAISNGIRTTFFDYPDSPGELKTGFDCSSLVCRAAQMAGIPYYFKNTATIAKNLKELDNDHLEEGDLILLVHGNSFVHVMVVSSVKNNLLVEAGSYKFGYGRVHECSLKKVFSNINTYRDLIKAAQNKEPVLRINNKGEIIEANQVKLIKMASVWS